jgi:hypothetical protein
MIRDRKAPRPSQLKRSNASENVSDRFITGAPARASRPADHRIVQLAPTTRRSR